jgi:hypothetical protein
MKKYIMMFSLILAVVMVSSCENYMDDLDFQVNLNKGLVVYWPVVGSDTYLKDFSSNGNDIGVHMNTSAVSIVAGRYSSAFRTNGTGIAYSYCDKYPSQIFSNSTEMTFMAWIKPWATSGNVISFSNGVSANFYIYYGSLVYDINFNGILINNIPCPYTDWTHIAGVKNGDGLLFYINGECVSQKKGSASAITVSRITIAANVMNTPYFNGALDEIRIYNRALSQDEIKALMDIGME